MATKPVFNDGDPGAEIRRKLNEMGDYFEDAAQDVDEAVQAAAEAKGYRDEAEGFAGAASGSALAASDSADSASGSASTANTKAGEAASSANTASTKAGEALASAQAAQEAADILADPAVQEVVEHIGDIQAVNANAANIDTVAGKAADVTTVAANSTNVTTVATNITAVNTAATNMAAIEAAPGAASTASSAASTATTKAGEASASALAAAGSASTASTKASEASGHADRAEQAAEDADDILQQVLAHGNGWTPVLAMASDGERRVVQVIDWTGGQGTKPATGYLGPTGIVASIASAVDVRGAAGAGAVSSVAMSAPTGFSVSGSPITTSGTLALSFASGYSLPTTAKQSQWDTAYGWGNHASAGYAVASSLATVAISGSYNDLSDKPSIPPGTVTSVGMSVPTGLSVSGSPVTGSGTLALAFASGYSLPTTAKQGQWDQAYGWGNHASAGYARVEDFQERKFVELVCLTDGTEFVVPSYCHFIIGYLVGGGGGGRRASDNGGPGGPGGVLKFWLPTEPSTVYSYVIGAGGSNSPGSGGSTVWYLRSGEVYLTAFGGSQGTSGGSMGGAGSSGSLGDLAEFGCHIQKFYQTSFVYRATGHTGYLQPAPPSLAFNPPIGNSLGVGGVSAGNHLAGRSGGIILELYT